MHKHKQERYTNAGKDLIDDWAERKNSMEFRAIMIGNIERYSRRYGKKDDYLSEARKIADYAARLVEYELSLMEDD